MTNVILSFPSLLNLTSSTNGSGIRRSWIQLARTGSFHSNRYGKFSITKTDLSQMFGNFTDITPKAPTELPIDYDHLSMDPKKPGDGIAAGWLKNLQLRAEGEELWGEVEWTPEGADRIANQEYRFVSPSFVKDHVHKDGKKIGTTLLAAAITNHPFLEGMRALTLYNFSAHGDLALVESSLSLAEIGQRVMIAPGNARTQDEIGGTFEVAEVVGEGDDSFVSIKDAGGLVHKWFRMTELLPASTVPANPAHPALQPGQAPVVPAAMPGVPVQPTSQSTNPAQVAAEQAQAAAAAAAGVPPVPGAVPGAPAAAPGAPAVPGEPPPDGKPGAPPPAGAKPSPFAKDGEPEDAEAGAKKKSAAKDNEGATGGDAAVAAVAAPVVPGAAVPGAVPGAVPAVAVKGAKKVAPGAAAPAAAVPGAATGDEDIDEMLKKAMAMLAGGGPQQKGLRTMMFTLRNDKNEEIKVSAEQLAAAGIKVVPEGSTAIPTNELSEMKGTITNLSSTVDTLKADVEAKAKEARTLELRSLLSGKLRGGFISKVTHDKLFDQYKDNGDLTMLRDLVATFTTPVLTLNKEHGSGGDVHEEKEQGEQAQDKIMALSATIAKERGISLSDAVKLAGAQLTREADAYREHYGNSTH